MTRRAFESVAKGLRDAIAHAEGDAAVRSRTKLHRAKTRRSVAFPSPSALKAARKQVGLTRDEFADAFGISPATLRKWENGERQPTGAARALLAIIAREPETALRVFRD